MEAFPLLNLFIQQFNKHVYSLCARKFIDSKAPMMAEKQVLPSENTESSEETGGRGS